MKTNLCGTVRIVAASSRTPLLVTVMVSLMCTLQAQDDGAGKDKLKFLDDALQALEKAKRRQLLEDSSQKVDERDKLLKSVRDKAVAAAKKRDTLPKVDEGSDLSRAKAAALIKRASPEARRLIASARSSDDDAKPKITTTKVSPPATPARSETPPISNEPATTQVDTPTIGGVPVPPPDTGADVPLNRKVRADNEKMRITCRGTSFYDKSGNVVLFEDTVVAKHPGFLIECEEMEVFLEAGAITPGSNAPKAKSTAARDSAGIRRAVAKGKGKQVDLVRYTPKGELVGKCGLVKYDGRTGDIELRDWPVVSNGKFTRRAATKGAVIIIRQNGEHKTTGKFLDDFEKADDNT